MHASRHLLMGIQNGCSHALRPRASPNMLNLAQKLNSTLPSRFFLCSVSSTRHLNHSVCPTATSTCMPSYFDSDTNAVISVNTHKRVVIARNMQCDINSSRHNSRNMAQGYSARLGGHSVPSRALQMHSNPLRRNFTTSAIVMDGMPDEPSELSDAAQEVILAVQPYMGEIQELGFGGMSPAGLMQQFMQYLAVNQDISWGAAIALTTIMLRVALFPVVVQTMKNNVTMMNCLPESKLHQERMQQCKKDGDEKGAMLAIENLQNLYKREGCSPMDSIAGMFMQMPVFLAMFFALRELGQAEVPSMMSGGTLWFTNLCAPDPYHILPVLSVGTMVLMIELGADGMQSAPQMKLFFRGLAAVTLIVTYNFPSAVFCYWCTTNVISLGQTALLKIPVVRAPLGIPPAINHGVQPSGGFNWNEFKDGISKARQEAEHKSTVTTRDAKKEAMANLNKLHRKRGNRNGRGGSNRKY